MSRRSSSTVLVPTGHRSSTGLRQRHESGAAGLGRPCHRRPRHVTSGGGQDMRRRGEPRRHVHRVRDDETNGDISELALRRERCARSPTRRPSTVSRALARRGALLADPIARSDRDLDTRALRQVREQVSPPERASTLVPGQPARVLRPRRSDPPSLARRRCGSRHRRSLTGAAPFSPDGTMLAFTARVTRHSSCTRSPRARSSPRRGAGAKGVEDPTWFADASASRRTLEGDDAGAVDPSGGRGAPRRLTNGDSKPGVPARLGEPRRDPLPARPPAALRGFGLDGRIRELPFQRDGTCFLDSLLGARDKRVFFSIHKKTGNIYLMRGDRSGLSHAENYFRPSTTKRSESSPSPGRH